MRRRQFLCHNSRRRARAGRHRGQDPADPTTTTTDRPFRYESSAPSRPFRFVVIKGVTDGCQEVVLASFQRSLEALRTIGSIEDVELPDLPYDVVTRTILHVEAASAFEEFIESGKIAGLTAPEDHYAADARDAILAKDYVKALRLRGVMAREADRVLSRLDALVAPGRVSLAPSLDQKFRSAIRGSAPDVMGAVGNGAGLPAVCVPNGTGDGGLPTSLQFMGRVYEENSILAAARAYQSLTDWHRQHPSVE